MQTKRRIAIIGLGMALKPHLEGLRELSGRIEIAGCYSPSAERREAFAAANPDCPVAERLDSLLRLAKRQRLHTLCLQLLDRCLV